MNDTEIQNYKIFQKNSHKCNISKLKHTKRIQVQASLITHFAFGYYFLNSVINYLLFNNYDNYEHFTPKKIGINQLEEKLIDKERKKTLKQFENFEMLETKRILQESCFDGDSFWIKKDIHIHKPKFHFIG